MLSETEGIVYSKLLMRTEQEKEGPRERGKGAWALRVGVNQRGQGRRGHAATGELLLFCFLRLREFLKERPGRGKGLGKITLRMLLDGFIF